MGLSRVSHAHGAFTPLGLPPSGGPAGGGGGGGGQAGGPGGPGVPGGPGIFFGCTGFGGGGAGGQDTHSISSALGSSSSTPSQYQSSSSCPSHHFVASHSSCSSSFTSIFTGGNSLGVSGSLGSTGSVALGSMGSLSAGADISGVLGLVTAWVVGSGTNSGSAASAHRSWLDRVSSSSSCRENANCCNQTNLTPSKLNALT